MPSFDDLITTIAWLTIFILVWAISGLFSKNKFLKGLSLFMTLSSGFILLFFLSKGGIRILF